MAKNDRLINAMKEVARRNREMNQQVASDKSTPMVYAGIALTLLRDFGWDKEQICQLINNTENVWNELGGFEVIKSCKDECDLLIWNDLIENEMREAGYGEWIKGLEG